MIWCQPYDMVEKNMLFENYMSNVNLSSNKGDISKDDPFEFSTNDPLKSLSSSILLINVSIGNN